MRRWRLAGCIVAVAAALAFPAGAQAGMLAFTSSRCDEANAWGGRGGCGPSIWVAHDDGSDLRRVTGKEVPGESLDQYARVWDEWPSWSRSGATVYFRRTHDVVQTLHALSIQDGSRRQIGPAVPNGQVPDYGEPAWSPDGQSVVFTSWTPGVTDQLRRDLYLMTGDGSIRRLTNGPPYYSSPVFTRDGTRILAQRTEPSGMSTIASMALDGGDVRPVFTSTSGAFQAPDGRQWAYLEYALSPDGKTLALNLNGFVYTTQLEGSILVRRSELQGVGAFQAGRLAFADEPGPQLITSKDWSHQVPLGSFDLTGKSGRTVILPCPCERRDPWPRQEYDSEPAWAPSTPRPQVDVTPPALELAAPAAGTARKRRPRVTYPVIRRGSIGIQAFDTSGVRGLDVSVSRVVGTRKGVRCRFLERRGFSPVRRCGRPRFRSLASGQALQSRLAALPAARYRLDIRAIDVHGRRSRAKLMRFALNPGKRSKKKR